MDDRTDVSDHERSRRAGRLVELLEDVDQRLSEGAASGEVRADIREALALARAQRDATRDAADSEDTPLELDDPLPRVLQQLCVDFRPATECEVELRMADRSQLKKLTARSAALIEDLIRELLEAYIDRGQADRVVVAVETDAGDMTVSVADEGTGFNPATVGPGQLNLRDLQRRVREVGGTVEWEASWEDGTNIGIRVPLGN